MSVRLDSGWQKVSINIFTFIGIICSGVGQLLICYNNWTAGVIFILTGLIIDLFDGVIARRYNLTTKVGAYLDTVNDILIYLTFPFLAIDFWLSDSLWVYGYGFLVICGLYRLFRHSSSGFAKAGYYKGLPVYYNFLLIVVAKYTANSSLIIILSVLIGILGISKISVKKFSWQQSLYLVTLISLITLWPK